MSPWNVDSQLWEKLAEVRLNDWHFLDKSWLFFHCVWQETWNKIKKWHSIPNAISLICLPLTFITKFQSLKRNSWDNFIRCQEPNHICRIKVVGCGITFWKLSLSFVGGKKKERERRCDWAVKKHRINPCNSQYISFLFPSFLSPR